VIGGEERGFSGVCSVRPQISAILTNWEDSGNIELTVQFDNSLGVGEH